MVFSVSEVGVNIKPTQQFALTHKLFRDAADALFKPVKEVVVHQPSSLPKGFMTAIVAQQLIPILFLYRHALELQLKETLARLDILDDKKPKGRKNHSLDALWKDVHKRLLNHMAPDQSSELLSPLEKHLNCVQKNLSRFHEVDPRSTTFRYPGEGKELPRFDILAFELRYQKTAAILDEVVNALGAFIDAK